MTYKERVKAKAQSTSHLYEGDCIRCKRKANDIGKKNDLCFSCEQDDLEFEEKKTAHLPDLNDREAMFKHEKLQQGWSDDRDEEIWNEHFRD